MLCIIVVFAQLISINAPLKGATGIDCAILLQMLFQSTLPLRGVQQFFRFSTKIFSEIIDVFTNIGYTNTSFRAVSHYWIPSTV